MSQHWVSNNWLLIINITFRKGPLTTRTYSRHVMQPLKKCFVQQNPFVQICHLQKIKMKTIEVVLKFQEPYIYTYIHNYIYYIIVYIYTYNHIYISTCIVLYIQIIYTYMGTDVFSSFTSRFTPRNTTAMGSRKQSKAPPPGQSLQIRILGAPPLMILWSCTKPKRQLSW